MKNITSMTVQDLEISLQQIFECQQKELEILCEMAAETDKMLSLFAGFSLIEGSNDRRMA